MDRLTELFASKPTSYMGLGVVYNGDTRGNGVTSQEQAVVVIPRFNQSDGGGGGATLALNCKRAGEDVSNIYVEVNAGTVLGVMPTIGGTALNAGTAPQLTITKSGTRHVVLNISGTPSVTTLDSRDFFHPTMSSITVTITSETTAPTGSDLVSSTGSFKALLATYVNGVKTAQNGYGPITGFVQDQLDGSGDGTLLLEYTD